LPNPPKQPLPSEKDLGEVESEIVGKGLRRIVEELRRNPQPARPPTEKPTSQ
jgi:hypothetical protein